MKNVINTMLAEQIIQAVEDVCERNINFIKPNGIIFASSNASRVGSFHEIGKKAAERSEIIEVNDDNGFDGTKKGVNIPIMYQNEVIAVIGISGEPEEVGKYTKLAVRITMLLIREQEIEDKERSKRQKRSYVIRSLTSGDTQNKAYLDDCLKDFKIDYSMSARTVIIKLDNRYNIMNTALIEQQINSLFSNPEVLVSSYIYPKEYIAIIKDKDKSSFFRAASIFAKDNSGILSVGVGTKRLINQQYRSYNAAKVALRSIEEKDKSICMFDELDIDILLGNVPAENKELYLKNTVDGLDKEDKSVLSVYFAEEMSLKSASERLFIHKNTMQYKLDRIAKITGYNPRVFSEAVVLYLALKI